MARIDNVTDFDRYRIARAREALAAAERLDMSDDRAMAGTIGRLRAVVEQLLEMLAEGGAS